MVPGAGLTEKRLKTGRISVGLLKLMAKHQDHANQNNGKKNQTTPSRR